MKNSTLFLLIIVAIIFVSTPAEATNWVVAGESHEDNMQFVDVDSISGGPAGPIGAWIKFESSKPRKDFYGKSIKYTTSYNKYFKNKSYCSLKNANHYTDETTETINWETYFNLPCEKMLQNITPGSMGELLWEFLFENPRSGKDTT